MEVGAVSAQVDGLRQDLNRFFVEPPTYGAEHSELALPAPIIVSPFVVRGVRPSHPRSPN